MGSMEFKFKSELWEWQGQGAWCFVSVPNQYYDEIRLVVSSPKREFGSVRVEANIRKTTWKTSIFPDTKSGRYLLPVKKDVRSKEAISVGDNVETVIRIIEI